MAPRCPSAPRPERLGLGARYVPHSGAMGVGERRFSEKVKREVQREQAAQSSDKAASKKKNARSNDSDDDEEEGRSSSVRDKKRRKSDNKVVASGKHRK